MCLIIHRPAGIIIPATLIANGIDNNPDGWGIMSAGKNGVRCERGMDARDFGAALQSFGAAALTVHFRLTTHGTTTVNNCHPFTFDGGRYACMHNGIIDLPSLDVSRSDTWHFVEHVLSPMLVAQPGMFGSDYLADVLGSIVGRGNKLVITRYDGASMIVNRDAGNDYHGLWLSNRNSLYSLAPTAGKQQSLSAWNGRDWPRKATGTAAAWRDSEYDRDVPFDHYVTEDDTDPADSNRRAPGIHDTNPDEAIWGNVPTDLIELADYDHATVSWLCEHMPDTVADLILDSLETVWIADGADGADGADDDTDDDTGDDTGAS